MTNQRRTRIFKRDNFTCQYCGKKPYKIEEVRSASGFVYLSLIEDENDKYRCFEIDHIFPRSKGGSNDESNLLTACTKCNREKSDRHTKVSDFINEMKVELAEMEHKIGCFDKEGYPKKELISLIIKKSEQIENNKKNYKKLWHKEECSAHK